MRFRVKVFVNNPSFRVFIWFFRLLVSHSAPKRSTQERCHSEVRVELTSSTMALLFAIIVILVTTAMSLPPVIRIGESNRWLHLLNVLSIATKFKITEKD